MSLSKAQAKALVQAARKARLRAYAPYSRFLVGAAVMDRRGGIHVGCNVENASFGLTVCAERNAIAAAVAAGARAIQAAVVVTEVDPPATPCGACRQVLAEFGSAKTPIWLAGTSGAEIVQYDLGTLLPASFGLAASR